MPSPIPTPVAAALGIVPTVLSRVRRLPATAVHLPVMAVSTALTGLEGARREYDLLARRGESLLARLRLASFDDLEDRVEDALQGTPLAEPYDRVEDALEDAAEGVSALARSARSRARGAAGSATRTVGGGLDRAADAVEEVADRAGGVGETAGTVTDTAAGVAEAAADTVTNAAAGVAGATPEEVPEAEAPKGTPTPKATEPDATRIDTAASSDVVETVEKVTSTLGGKILPHDELPLPDYDHLTLGSLRGRMRSLDLPQLIQIRDYEKAHADRLPIVTMLDNRIAKLANDPAAPLSDAPATAAEPAKAGAGPAGSKVSPATSGPPMNPPSQGVPTNPTQPRS